MKAREARERFARARVARLATLTPDGRPHLVPVVFAVLGDTVYSAVDAKPKRTLELARLPKRRGASAGVRPRRSLRRGLVGAVVGAGGRPGTRARFRLREAKRAIARLLRALPAAAGHRRGAGARRRALERVGRGRRSAGDDGAEPSSSASAARSPRGRSRARPARSIVTRKPSRSGVARGRRNAVVGGEAGHRHRGDPLGPQQRAELAGLKAGDPSPSREVPLSMTTSMPLVVETPARSGRRAVPWTQCWRPRPALGSKRGVILRVPVAGGEHDVEVTVAA